MKSFLKRLESNKMISKLKIVFERTNNEIDHDLNQNRCKIRKKVKSC